ncbi:hypothetical protein G5V59_17135 [Nocardioides sp. W3-2-3]|uniref:hypothetical protein n=1 Tax=Nocardioides convexus TaxID=2712224 RepID=UPI00241896EB|nr:hypothetical protein [Nocardioides convexus]NHA01021.1 hypothetical protein [Nocardioides convexus]
MVPPTELVGEAGRERLLTDRAGLIYKPARGYGGEGVVAGWEIGAERWAEHLASGVPAVVQQRAVPVAEDGVHADGTPWVGEAVLGIYYLPESGFAGGGARLHAFGEPFVTESGQAPPSQRAAILLSDGRRLDGPAA